MGIFFFFHRGRSSKSKMMAVDGSYGSKDLDSLALKLCLLALGLVLPKHTPGSLGMFFASVSKVKLYFFFVLVLN